MRTAKHRRRACHPSTVELTRWALAAGLGASALLARAEEPSTPAAAESTLPAVIVTGEKIPRPIEESTSAVTVFTRSQLARSAVKDVTDLATRTPGLAVSYDNRDIAIRGITRDGFGGTRDALTPSFNDLIGVYIDGAPISVRAGANSLWDLDQIEVFRGAQTTNFGRNALGGVVNIRTADPVLRNEFAARLGAGNLATGNASAMANVVLPGESAALRFSVDKFRTDGSIENVTAGVRADPQDRLTWRGKLLLQPGPDTRVVLGISRIDVKQGAQFVTLDRFPSQRVATNDVPEHTDKTSDIFTLRVDHALNDRWSLALATAAVRDQGFRTLDADASPLPLAKAQVTELTRDTSQEAKLVYEDPTTQTRAAVGLFLRRYNQNARDEASGAFNFVNQVTTKTSGQALFGEYEWRLAPAWRAIVGGRFDRESVDAGIETLGGGGLTNTSRTATEFLPKLSLGYDLSPASTLTGTVQRAYRPGGSGASLFSGTRYDYEAEYTDNFDLAYRSTWLNKALTFNAQAYWVNWKNQQVVTSSGGNPFDSTTVNAGRSRMQGLELDLAYRWTPHWSTYAIAAFQRNRFKEFDAGGGVSYAGNRFPNAPAATVTLGAQYQARNGWYAGAEVTTRSSSYSDAANTPSGKIGGYSVVNLKGGWQTGAHTLSAYVRNALDRDVVYAKYVSLNNAAVGDPRTIGVEWTVRF
jgi:outer membrane receptor protein involved in Fe transport